MRSRIFSFEIEKAVADGLFEATDTRIGAKVLLYEWTPPELDRDAAKLRLSEAIEQIPCEVFTADATLYLAAQTPEEAGQALAILQQHDLFPGPWDRNGRKVAPPAPPPAPSPFPPPLMLATSVAPVRRAANPQIVQATAPQPKKKSGCAGCLGVFLFLVLLGVLLLVFLVASLMK